ncbi:hypothetical protein J8273_6729 [Carpediemonas membranifera]|uniref:Uncharacterized protein n=1 Tax=Carpediemonas membranifera TaxID=201153 RepID=A0A8J6B123_9EUKA|nr:hypothetical protein J8273_6729 [Carpediemonas membranifera]|eukprot:KAG9391999.1 hypothetical protein J8273_6729 [Carpediemonas membranifera]
MTNSLITWVLGNLVVSFPPDTTGDHICCAIYSHLFSSRLPGFNKRKIHEENVFQHAIRELGSMRNDISQCFTSNVKNDWKRAVQRMTSSNLVTVHPVNDEVERLRARVQELEKQLRDTTCLLDMMSSLNAILSGKNNDTAFHSMFNSFASRLGLDTIGRTQKRREPIAGLDMSILNIPGLREALSEEEVADLSCFIPVEYAIQEAGVTVTADSSRLTVPIGQTVNFIGSQELIDATVERLQLTPTDAVRFGQTTKLLYADAIDAKQARDTVRADRIHRRQGLRSTIISPNPWDFVSSVFFDCEAICTSVLLRPMAFVADKPARKTCLEVCAKDDEVEAGRVFNLELCLWVDGWKHGTTAVKFRLGDKEGIAIPGKLTRVFTLLEFIGHEDQIPSLYPRIAAEISNLVNLHFCVRQTGAIAQICRVHTLADNKALQVLLGTMRGGKNRCVFSVLSDSEFISNPYGFSTIRDRIAAANPQYKVISVQLSDLLLRRQMYYAAQKQEIDHLSSTLGPGRRVRIKEKDRITLDLQHRYGKYKWDENQFIPLFQDSPALAELTTVAPPLMHTSHELLEQVACLVKMFPQPPRNPELSFWRQQSGNTEFVRTVGCNEQERARARLAVLATSHITCVPECVRELFRVIAHLQHLYYSMEDPTPELIRWHWVAAAVIHAFHTAMSICPDGSYRTKTKSAEMKKPCVITLKMHAAVAVIPLIHQETMLPLTFMLEEHFERSFLPNMEMKQRAQRARILHLVSLMSQAKYIKRALLRTESAGRRQHSIPALGTLVAMHVHECVKSAQMWKKVRGMSVDPLENAGLDQLKRDLTTFWRTFDSRMAQDVMTCQVVWDDGMLHCQLPKRTEPRNPVEITVCICEHLGAGHDSSDDEAYRPGKSRKSAKKRKQPTIPSFGGFQPDNE